MKKMEVLGKNTYSVFYNAAPEQGTETLISDTEEKLGMTDQEYLDYLRKNDRNKYNQVIAQRAWREKMKERYRNEVLGGSEDEDNVLTGNGNNNYTDDPGTADIPVQTMGFDFSGLGKYMLIGGVIVAGVIVARKFMK